MMDEKILGRRMKRKRQFGFNPDDDETIICRRVLLNTLKDGPAPIEWAITEANKQFGFTRAEVLEAARHWNFTTEELDGSLYWVKPACLVPLRNWDYRRRQSGPMRMEA
jgi:hypothetical protein